MQRNLNGVLVAVLLVSATSQPVMARGNDLTIKSGFGEEVTVKNGFFGRKTTTVKDRLGNGYSSKGGLFGSKETNVSVLGNNLKQKKGVFGGSEVQGSTIFGDKVSTKKGLFGRRTTTVDMTGTSTVVKSLWQKHGAKLLGSSQPAKSNNTLAPLTAPAQTAGSEQLPSGNYNPTSPL